MQQHDARTGVVEPGNARAKFEAVRGDADKVHADNVPLRDEPGVRGCIEQWQRGSGGTVLTSPIQRHQTAGAEHGQQRDEDQDQHDDETADQSHAVSSVTI